MVIRININVNLKDPYNKINRSILYLLILNNFFNTYLNNINLQFKIKLKEHLEKALLV
jgi:hypothetical protein